MLESIIVILLAIVLIALFIIYPKVKPRNALELRLLHEEIRDMQRDVGRLGKLVETLEAQNNITGVESNADGFETKKLHELSENINAAIESIVQKRIQNILRKKLDDGAFKVLRAAKVKDTGQDTYGAAVKKDVKGDTNA